MKVIDKKHNRQILYNSIFFYICLMKKIILIYFFFSCSILAKANDIYRWRPVYPMFDSLVMQVEQTRLYRADIREIETAVQKMYRIAHQSNNPILLSRAMHWDAQNQLYQNADSASVLLSRAILLIDTVKYSYDYARIKYLQQTVFLQQSDFLKAYETCNDLLAYFKQTDDDFFTANVLVQMGIILSKLQEYQVALTYLEEAGSFYKKVGVSSYYVKNKLNISNVLYSIGQKKDAVEMLQSLVNDSICRQDTSFLIGILLSLTSYTTDVYDKERYAIEAYNLAQSFGHKQRLTRTLINRAALFLEQSKNDSALVYLKRATYTVSTNDIDGLRLIYENMSHAYANYHQWDSAYHYSNLYHLYNDSVLGADKVIEINKIQAREAILQLEQEKKEAEFRQKIAFAILFSICCLFISFILTVRSNRKKMKIEKQLKEAENKELNERLKNEHLQKQNLQLEIDSKNRELSSNILLLSEKNRVFENLVEQINKMRDNGIIPVTEEKILRKQINDHLQATDEWEYFKLHFESVHPGFFTKLKEQFPALSENELRLCAYIRIGMTAKQIAQMLSVLPETINTSRYRIRKKMKLETDVSLEDFLRDLINLTIY